MSTIFTKIINREIPAQIVWENDKYIAFLDIKPINPGHLLLVPKTETAYIFDLPDETYSELMLIAKKLAKPLQLATQAKKIGLAIEGFGVDHVHIHLVPINNMNEMDPNRAQTMEESVLINWAEKIKQAINKNY